MRAKAPKNQKKGRTLSEKTHFIGVEATVCTFLFHFLKSVAIIFWAQGVQGTLAAYMRALLRRPKSNIFYTL